MNWSISLYVLLLFIPVIPQIVVAILVLQRRDKPGGLPLGLLLVAAAVWSLTAAGEAAVTTIPAKVFWSQLSYIGIYGTPFFLILFTLEFIWQTKQLGRRYILALGIIPLLIILLAFSNAYHRLIWSDYVPIPGSTQIIYEHGAAFWIGFVYAYAVLAVSAYLLLRQAIRFQRLYREQSLMILLSLLPPWLANIVFLFRLDPAPGRDFTPLAFALTSLILAWAMRRLHFLDLAPIARDSIIEEMRDGMLVLDEQGRVTDVNPAASRLIGLPTRKMLGQPAAMLLADLGLKLGALGEGKKTRIEAALDDGRYVACRIWSLPHPGALPTGHLLLLQDVTSQKKAQKALQKLNASLEAQVAARTAEIQAEKERNDAILRSVGDGILIVDRDFEIRYANSAFIALSGHQPAELLDQPVAHLVSEESAAKLRQMVVPALNRGKMWQGDVHAQRKDGRFFDVSLTITPLQDESGESTGYVYTLRDVTRRKQLERTRSQLLQNISHQLQTPLTNLMLYLELSQRTELSDRLRHNLQVMDTQIEWLSQIIESTLEMAALESGDVITRWEQMDPGQLISYAVERYRTRAEEKGVTLRIRSLPLSLPSIEGDPERLVQAVSKLVENGITFTKEGGEVVIGGEGGRKKNGRAGVAIIVQDDGPGVSVEEQTEIFARFYRGEAAQTGNIPGAGLGLSIAQAIINAHGGHISVESDNAGSTFYLWLPEAISANVTQLDAHLQH